jgi:hypothetical protein
MQYVRVIASHNEHSVAMDANIDSPIRDDSGMDDTMVMMPVRSQRATHWSTSNVVSEEHVKESTASGGTEESTVGLNKKHGNSDEETENYEPTAKDDACR